MRAFGSGIVAVFALALGCSATPDDSPRPTDPDPGPTSSLDAGEDAAERPSPARDAGADGGPRPTDAGPEDDAAPDGIEGDGDAEDASPDAGFEDAPEEPDAAIDAPDDVAEEAEPDAGEDEADAGAEPDAGDAEGGGEAPIPDEPRSLEEAGLYRDFDGRVLAEGIRFYEPAFKLWSDGAEKERYVYLPPGSLIDTSDPDAWKLPEGTRLYKTFRIHGRPVETRFLRKLQTGWFLATYAWNAEGNATHRVVDGVRNALGTGYEIPDQTTCKGCHAGGSDMALGFELISLANEGATGLNLAALNDEGWLSHRLWGDYSLPGDALDRAALGWLHANCGTACHNGHINAKGYWTGFYMLLHSRELHSVESTATWRTGAFVTSNFQPGGPLLHRISPGRPDRSAIVYRSERRGTTEQMPPMDTNKVDEEGVATLRAWIEGLR